MRTSLKTSMGILVGLFFLLCSPLTSWGNINLRITPLIFEYDVSPGDKLTGTLKIVNGSNQKQKLQIYSERVRPQADKGGVTFNPVGGMNISGRDFAIEPKDSVMEIAPNEIKEIKFTVTIPAKIDPGEHYKGLSVEAFPVGVNPNSQVIIGKVTVPIIVRLKGNALDTGRVVSFRPEKDVFNNLPLKFLLTFENTGNVSYYLNGIFFIRHQGQVLAALKIEDKAVFPAQIGTAEIVWEKNDNGQFPEGEYEVFGKVLYGQKGQRKEDFRSTVRYSMQKANLAPNVDPKMDQLLLIIQIAGTSVMVLALLFAAKKWYSAKKAKDMDSY